MVKDPEYNGANPGSTPADYSDLRSNDMPGIQGEAVGATDNVSSDWIQPAGDQAADDINAIGIRGEYFIHGPRYPDIGQANPNVQGAGSHYASEDAASASIAGGLNNLYAEVYDYQYGGDAGMPSPMDRRIDTGLDDNLTPIDERR